jgi:amidase
MAFKEYEDYDGLGLAALIAGGEVSELEVLEAAIERIERHNPRINAVTHVDYARARKLAREGAPDGPFKGVPFLLKDLKGEDRGQPATSSTRLLADWSPARDSVQVERYKRAGLNIVGRTNTPEFGIYAVTEPELHGATLNPWNLGHTPGGSSGGAGAAVAARMIPVAHASDGGGSIRIPASHGGLFGLKPTRARNTLAPYMGEGWAGMAIEHVVSVSVRDSAALLDATCGPAPGDPYQVRAHSGPFLDEVGKDPGKLRIAFTTRALFATDMHPDNVAAVRESAKILEDLGHDVEEACPVFDRETLVRAYLVFVSAGVANAIADAGRKAGVEPRAEHFEPATWLLKLVGDSISASEYVSLMQVTQRAARDVARFFERYDVFVTATTAKPPVRIGEFATSRAERAAIDVLRRAPARPLLEVLLKQLPKGPLSATPNTMLFNMTGQPACSVPLYWNRDRLPIGTQLVGRFGDEATLLRLASQIEQARPWKDRKAFGK